MTYAEAEACEQRHIDARRRAKIYPGLRSSEALVDGASSRRRGPRKPKLTRRVHLPEYDCNEEVLLRAIPPEDLATTQRVLTHIIEQKS